MVAGALGQLLLEAPCASPRAGLRALRRTADPPAENQEGLGAGILNVTTAGQYLHRLHMCQSPPGRWQHLVARIQRLGSGIATYVGLIAYFFLSIFAVPFLIAFIIDKLEQRAARLQEEAIQRAYAGSADYRQQRLLALKHVYMRTHKVRHRERAELTALLHVLYLYGEPCWWCGAAATEPCGGVWYPTDALQQCSRCGWEMAAPYQMLEDEGENATSD